MFKNIVVIFATLIFAFGILVISILRTASVEYSFSNIYADFESEKVQQENQALEEIEIEYYPAYPGSVLPDHPLWSLKVLRDKIWLLLTTDLAKKAELNLLFADKRLGSAKVLFEKEKPELGYTTLTKAEKYLKTACELEAMAREEGTDTLDLVRRLTLASLKHRQIMEQIELIAPEDARPKINAIEDVTKAIYQDKSTILKDAEVPYIENPFNGE